MKIVFIDIDGPIICTPQYLIDPMASNKRSPMNTNAIGWINSLCNRSGAKLVTNTAHNYYITPDGLDLRESLIKNGIHELHFHEEWRTNYYNPFYIEDETDIPDDLQNDRHTGILDFVNKHKVDNFVMFDDMRFTKSKRLIHVTFDEGITYNDYINALEILGVENEIGDSIRSSSIFR